MPAPTCPPPGPPGLYPDVAPFHAERLAVPGGHTLAVTQHGSPDGIPLLLLHGGPGSGCSPLLRRFFDPARYRLICPDQRGAGASRPAGGVRHNTTADLLADLRALREHLGLARWWVAGGSWGATLALAHALDQPEAVPALLLRAVFLARPADIAGFFQRSTAPDAAAEAAWDALAALLPAADGGALPPALAEALVDEGGEIDTPPSGRQRATAAAWWAWEQALTRPGQAIPRPDATAQDALVARYRVQAHYLRHGCWLQAPPLLQRLAPLAAMPTLILHGDADRICPPEGAQALQRALPQGVLHRVPGAGHDPSHPAMVAAMRAATDAWAHDHRAGTRPATPCRCA